MKNTMLHRTAGLITFLLLILSIGLAGCDSFGTTPIQKILENPRDYAGKTVKIAGEVTEVFSFIVIRYYTVKDTSGEITVVTQRTLPKAGAKITVEGTVEEAFSIGNKQLIVIAEKNP